MNPRQFEELVCEHFRNQGYKAETTPYNNDMELMFLQQKEERN